MPLSCLSTHADDASYTRKLPRVLLFCIYDLRGDMFFAPYGTALDPGDPFEGDDTQDVGQVFPALLRAFLAADMTLADRFSHRILHGANAYASLGGNLTDAEIADTVALHFTGDNRQRSAFAFGVGRTEARRDTA